MFAGQARHLSTKGVKQICGVTLSTKVLGLGHHRSKELFQKNNELGTRHARISRRENISSGTGAVEAAGERRMTSLDVAAVFPLTC